MAIFITSLYLPLALISFSILYIFSIYKHTSKQPPHGPKSYPLIGCFIPFYKNRRRLLDWYTSLLSASPSQTIVIDRLGARRTVVTANPATVEHILKTNFHNYPKGKPFTDILGDLLGCGIFNVDGELWHTQRKLASHEFTTGSLREFVVRTLESETDHRLLPILASACKEGRIVDMQDLLRRFAFDTICNISLGSDPGLLDANLPDSDLATAFDVASMISAMRGAAPVAVLWKVKRMLHLGSEVQLRSAVNMIHGSVMDLIQQRKKDAADNKTNCKCNDLLSRLLSGGHPDEVTRDMVISFIMAGRDTTSSALTWFFYLLSCHPEIEHQILTEIKTFDTLDYEELKKMKVLEASLCESMRLYPPVVWDSKHAIVNDVLPCGTEVKAGDRVTYFQYGMGRMEALWGEEWAMFDPKRWLEGEGRMSPYKFAVFQAGPRVCLGKEMAFAQMKYVAASVIRRFEVRRAEEGTPVLVPLLTAHMKGGLKVMVRER